MTIEVELMERCEVGCEMCNSTDNLAACAVDQTPDELAVTPTDPDRYVMACNVCREQIQNPESADPNHWRCLNDSMWSQVPAVQVIAWRMLYRLRSHGWPQDLLATFYLEDEVREWAESDLKKAGDDSETPTLDSNGTRLTEGDTVTLIKDLVVKGAGFTAKRGTTVKNVSLTSTPEHIEGRVNGTEIVLVANFLKKVN